MMAAYVVEGAQNAIIPTNRDDRFIGDACRDELAGFFDQVEAPDHLPGLAENCLRFEVCDARIHVPGSGNCGCFRKRSFVVVAGENLIERIGSFHFLNLKTQSSQRKSAEFALNTRESNPLNFTALLRSLHARSSGTERFWHPSSRADRHVSGRDRGPILP